VEFAFSDSEQQFADSLRRYTRDRLLKEYSKWDQGAPYPRERVRELSDLGITGLRVPAKYGGAEASYILGGIAAEEIGRGDFNVTLFVQLSMIAADILGGFATDPVKDTWLTKLAAGDCVFSFGLTEPGAGSDAAAITTTATRDGDSFVIRGEKATVTFCGLADVCIVFARMGGKGARGIGAVLVPLHDPGVTRRPYRSLGEHLSQRGSLIFDNVRVPAENLLGSESEGFVQAMAAFDYNRAIIALACVGAALQSLEETVEYAKQRQTFGKPIARHEGVSFQIAEHLTLVNAARLLGYQCLALRDQGKPHTKEAAMAKWLGPKTAADAIHSCIILHGWMGYDQDLPFEQRLRDVIGLEIGDGTPEIMKAIIARETFGREFSPYK
jgi:cyclohexanecarboxyl-CoA dehydrogenase